VKRAVLWDSSAILALLDADDADHARAVATARKLAQQRLPAFITNYIEVECHALLLRKLGRSLAREWLLRGGMSVLRATRADEDAARALLAAREDKDWSLCDAISFAVIARLGLHAAFSFDGHFRQAGGFEVLGPSK
jgi:predicted nucleic acid-binding protein